MELILLYIKNVITASDIYKTKLRIIVILNAYLSLSVLIL